MRLAEIVYSRVKSLPEPEQKEVLDFVDYLLLKSRQDDLNWSSNSLIAAVRGLETDNWLVYDTQDLKEQWQ
jgi:hypothetical protein